MIRRAFTFVPLAGLVLLSSGCFLQKSKVAPVPPAPAPVTAPVTVPPPVAAPQPKPQTQPPTVQPAAPAPEPAKPSPFPGPPITTPPAQVPSRPRPTPVTPAPVTPTPSPTLGAILSADQRKQLDAAYQADLKQANAVLNGLGTRKLTAEQTDTVNRSRSFIRQAAQFHDRDLTTAAELARRAKVLAQDLAGTLK